MAELVAAMVEDFKMTLLAEDAEETTLHALRAGRVAVFGAEGAGTRFYSRTAAPSRRVTRRAVSCARPCLSRADCWTTKCERCPAAIDKIEAIAAAGTFAAADVLWCSLNLDDREFAAEIVDEHDWEHLAHAFMDRETKEAAKRAWGFSAVPFVVVVARDGAMAWCGPPKGADLEARVAAALAPPPRAAAEEAPGAAGDENAKIVANAPAATAATKVAPAPAPAREFVLDEDF